MANTLKLQDVNPDDFDALFYPGGHGPLWDLAEDPHCVALTEQFQAQGKPVAAVCHAPAVLRHARNMAGNPPVMGKQVTGFSNSEEEAVQLTQVVPFLVEEMLKGNCGHYSRAENWQSHVIVDGLLFAGQNPAFSDATADALLKLL